MVKCLCRVSANLKRLIFSYMMETDAGLFCPTCRGTSELYYTPHGSSGGDCDGGLRRLILRIAAASDDGVKISQHFGRAPYYVVVTVEEERIMAKETRSKPGHQTFAAHQPPKLAPDERHGYDAGSDVRHESMANTISDCQVLLVGGMGWGAYEAMKSYGIEPIATDVKDIEEAVKLYLAGKLSNLMERLH